MPTLILSSAVLAEIIHFLFRYLSPRLLCHSIICPPPPRAASLSPSLYLFSVSVRREGERASEQAEGEKRHKLDQTTSYQICHRTEKFPRVTLSRLCNGSMAAAAVAMAAAMRAKLTYYSVAGRRARNVLCGLLRQ